MPPSFPFSIQRTVLRRLPNPLSSLYVAITLYGLAFQRIPVPKLGSKDSPATPHLYRLSTTDSVCAMRFSVALTYRISIDFSSGGY